MTAKLSSLAVYLIAALAEIGGCYAVWAWLRLGRSALWLLPGFAALALFALMLTRIEADFAGRAYAAYGGIYIAAALAWGAAVESRNPDLWDLAGAAIACLGALVILFAPR